MRTSRMIGTVIPTWVDNSCLIQSMQLGFIRCIKFIVGWLLRSFRGTVIKPSAPHIADLSSSLVYAQPFVTMMHCEANYIAESTQFCP